MYKTKHNNASRWLKFLVLTVILALLCPAGAAAQERSSNGLAAANLGMVKVRVVDNVQRLANEVSSLEPNYREPFGVILPTTEIPITEGLNMRGALENALATKNIRVYGAQNYVSGIGPVTSADGTRTVDKLSEFDGGRNSGWMVNLNDWFINAGANSFTVKDGDVVEFCYTCNSGVDVDGDFYNTDTSLRSLSVSTGTLSPGFSSGIKNYSLSLPAAMNVIVTPTAANRTNKVIIESGGNAYRRTDAIPVVDQQVITVTCAENIYRITVAIAGGGNQDQERADGVSSLIAALPDVGQITLADSTRIGAARAAYNALSAAQKALVTNLAKLTAAEARLAELQNSDTTPPVITVKDPSDQLISEDLTVPEPSFSFKVTALDEKDGYLSPGVQLNGTGLQAVSNGIYICTLTQGSNALTITAMDAAGNRAEKSLTINLGSLAYQKAVIDSSKKIVTLTFNMAIFNNKASLEELKDAVTYAINGASYTPLNEADQVSIVGKTLRVAFDTALTGNSNEFKLAANSLKDAAGNVLSSEVTTEGLYAGEIDECFIATAAFGSKYQPDVVLLRQFRDRRLLTNPLGQAFVNFYYRYSPPIASFIAHSEWLKVTVRGMLIPLVVIAYALLHPGVMVGTLTIVGVTIADLRRRKRNRLKTVSITGR